MTLRVYVAGASKEPERVRWAMGAIRDAGHIITLDWLDEIAKAGAANEGLSDEARRGHAADDLAAVASADVIWLLAPDNASAGAWVELGYAIGVRDGMDGGSSLRIAVSGPARMRCIFASFANYEADSDFDALRWVLARQVQP